MKFLIESVNHSLKGCLWRASFEEYYPELAKLCKRENNNYYIEINNLQDLEKVYHLVTKNDGLWNNKLIIDFDGKEITIYDGWME